MSGQRFDDIALCPGRTVDPDSGLLKDCPGCAADLEPFFHGRGASFKWRSPSLEYRLFYYSPEIDERILHTYWYQPESVWASYVAAASGPVWSTSDRIIEKSGYYRMAVRSRCEGELPKNCGEAAEVVPERTEPDMTWMTPEIGDTVRKIRERRREGDLLFFLLSDTHYGAGCRWDDTLYSLKKTAEETAPDGVIHLGDLTDGITPLFQTLRYADRVIGGLRSLGVPVHLCIGNHDMNYFRGNPEVMTEEQCAVHYLGQRSGCRVLDFPDQRLRTIFLDSFSPFRRERYGFSAREVLWLCGRLLDAPDGFRILVLSHVTPAAEMHVWSRRILNGDIALRLLKVLGNRGNRRVLGWICGHNHADQFLKKHSVPIVAVGCGKPEDFTDHKPYGSVTYPREIGTASQELWDALLIGRDGRMEFIRCGAGRDRRLQDGEWQEDADEGTGSGNAQKAPDDGTGASQGSGQYMQKKRYPL